MEQWDFGAYPCVIKEGSLANKVYERKEISERHRHRYEYNNEYKEMFEKQNSPNYLLETFYYPI